MEDIYTIDLESFTKVLNLLEDIKLEISKDPKADSNTINSLCVDIQDVLIFECSRVEKKTND